MQAEVDEEESWLKRTVSLPSLPRGPRPSLWQRAEGENSFGMDGDFRRSKSDMLSAQSNLLRSSSGKWNLNPEEALSRDASFENAARCSGASGYPEKRKKEKKIDLLARESAHMDKHRQLKQMLRQERQDSGSLSSCKRLVGGLMSSKDTHRRKLIDQQKAEKSIKRIQGHLHDCSHARHELVAMQRKMALLSDPPMTFCSDLHHIFADTLKRTHSQDDF
jgi:hypothetical protein